MSSPDDPQELLDTALIVDESVSLTISGDLLLILDDRPAKSDRRCCGLLQSKPETNHAISLYNILGAETTASNIVIAYAQPASKDNISVTTVQYPISEKEKKAVETWVRQLLDRAYAKALRGKRLKILVNPFGGKGTAASLYQRYAAPVFAAAKCQVDVQTTEYRGHGIEIAENLDIDAYDAVVCCSGDGLPYEVFNGLGKRPDARKALAQTAIALLPCGSGNGLTWNAFGTGSVSIAALAIVKGLRTPLDLISITQKDSRTLSFLSQSFGIVAECDLATENIRWMGAQRFTYGFLVRLIRQTIWPCDIAIKVEIGDKEGIKKHYAAWSTRPQEPDADSKRLEIAAESPGLPELKYGTVTDELPQGWEVVSGETMGNFYAGNMAIMSKDTNMFPATLPDDGLMDVITIDGTVSRGTAISMMNEIPTGRFFDMPDLNVRKASAFRLVPHQKEGYISIDGERVPFEAFQAEVHQGLGTILTKSGRSYEAAGPP
ncbi:ATP-NAD kinase, PpnK-type [Penicillium expansum]|uniref:ATP-NAD kinase, PpnK-type n=1 Tax=Penicillium expansum TaxID=27334 RepID=A0A0A2IG70_PENEN|nr:ATP-NAD kinase, PpnK-type [Penicillium expansum]KGO39250.1 ATP-NAD kinase, PpnK-type [Penicillium expansum]KGO42659.1 ATP-NAD kinase, PpnK-type [Penicillium expansum]KGO50411.1 ATP-NAD kinase, PpnK-type [Penicillium expansum]